MSNGHKDEGLEDTLERLLRDLPKPPSDPRSDELAQLLEQLAKNVSDRFYKNKVVYLDGYTFTNCGFHGCTLVTDSGAFLLKRCTLFQSTFQFGPNAVRILKLWNTFNLNIAYPNFNPYRHEDGSITVE